MKNLVPRLHLIEDTDIRFLSNRLYKKDMHLYSNWDKRHSSDYHKVRGQSLYTFLHRFIEHRVGKSFDRSFSYFCSIVPWYQQKFFLKEFDHQVSGTFNHNDYYVDEQGLIARSPRRTGYRSRRYYPHRGHVIQSHDYQVGWAHKKSGRIIPANDMYWRHDADYERVVIKGRQWHFEKKNNEYHRIYAEQSQIKSLIRRRTVKFLRERTYNFTTDSERKWKDMRLSIVFTTWYYGGNPYHGKNKEETIKIIQSQQRMFDVSKTNFINGKK